MSAQFAPLSSEISSTYPSQNSSVGGGSYSVLKKFRNFRFAAAELIVMLRVIIYLSLIPF